MTYLTQYIEPADAWDATLNSSKSTPFFNLALGDFAILLGGSATTNFDQMGFIGGTYPVTFSPYDGIPKARLGLAWPSLPTTAPLSLSAYASVPTPSYIMNYGFAVLAFRGIKGTGAIVATNGLAAPSLPITTTVNNSSIAVICVDNVAIDGASRTWRQVNGANPTELRYFRSNQALVTQPYTVYIALYEDAGAAGAKTVGLSAPGGQNFSIAALELIPRTLGSKTVSWAAQLIPALGAAIVDPSPYELRNNANIAASWIFNDTQTDYRAEIFSDSYGRVRVYDSGLVASATQAATLATGAALISNTLYYLRIYAQNGTTSQGQTALVPFYYALPASVNITGLRAVSAPVCNPLPSDNPAIVLTWTVPAPSETFLAYEVRRRKRGETSYIPIVRIKSQITNHYTDANIVPGQEYEYVVVFYGDTGGVTKVSAEQTTPVRATVLFDFIYIHEVENQQTEFFRISSLGGTVGVQQDIVTSTTWGRASPAVFVGEKFTTAISLPGLDKLRKRPADWAKFVRMAQRQGTVGSPLCVRFGLDRELYFVSMVGLSKSLAQRSWTETVQLQEVAYEESIGYYVHTPGQPA